MKTYKTVRTAFVLTLSVLCLCSNPALSAPGVSQVLPLSRSPERIGSLGATGLPVKLTIAGRIYAGTFLSHVSEFGLAYRSGLRQTDVLIYVNQKGTADPKTTQRVVNELEGGSNTNLSFARNVRGTYQFAQIVTAWGKDAVRSQTPARVNAGPKATPAASQVESNIFSLVNAERAKHKLGRLSSNSALAAVALKHAQDMHKRRFFSHTNPDGKDFGQRAKDAGINAWIGENLEKISLFPTAAQMASSGHDQFMHSTHHRDNILEPRWKSMGLGTVYEGDGTMIVVQMFQD